MGQVGGSQGSAGGHSGSETTGSGKSSSSSSGGFLDKVSNAISKASGTSSTNSERQGAFSDSLERTRAAAAIGRTQNRLDNLRAAQNAFQGHRANPYTEDPVGSFYNSYYDISNPKSSFFSAYKDASKQSQQAKNKLAQLDTRTYVSKLEDAFRGLTPVGGWSMEDIASLAKIEAAYDTYNKAKVEEFGGYTPESWGGLQAQTYMGQIAADLGMPVSDYLGPDEAMRMAQQKGLVSLDAYGNPVASFDVAVQPVAIGAQMVGAPAAAAKMVARQFSKPEYAVPAAAGAAGLTSKGLASYATPDSSWGTSALSAGLSLAGVPSGLTTGLAGINSLMDNAYTMSVAGIGKVPNPYSETTGVSSNDMGSVDANGNTRSFTDSLVAIANGETIPQASANTGYSPYVGTIYQPSEILFPNLYA